MSERFDILYADPPWLYRNKKTGGSMKSGSACKYVLMDTQQICALPVPAVMARDSVLFLWTTSPMLQDALQVMKAWGYKYKTKVTWVKTTKLGMGFWFRGQTEDLLLGVRGRVKAFRSQRRNVLMLEPRAHSEKPEEFRGLIEEVTASMPLQRRLELFATRQASGWRGVGLSLDGRTVEEVLSEWR